MLWRLRSILRRLRLAMRPMRERGLGQAAVLLVHVPVATMLRAWRVMALQLNRAVNQHQFNRTRLTRFLDALPASALPRLMVIVMPSTLHFLLPCLALLQGRAQLILLGNGAHRWEHRTLRERFPELPMFDLRTLPASSVAHGDVISLLLAHHRGNFGIVDHDCYVFDGTLFDQLEPANGEVLVSLFGEKSRDLNATYPLTHLMYFNAEALRGLMQRHRIDARLYRETPPSVRDALARQGLGPGIHWKWYHTFHDTLLVLVAVAQDEGLRVRYLTTADEAAALHVGGTSIGSHHTKSLAALYTHLCFLELLDDPLLWRGYAFMAAPLKSSKQALALLRADADDPASRGLPVVERLMQRLRDRLQAPAGCAGRPGSAVGLAGSVAAAETRQSGL